MNKYQFRVGLVGAGYISEYHIHALHRLPNVQIVGITDLEESRARTAKERFNLAATFPSLQRMAAEGLDAVHILTPPRSHAALTLEAMELGNHVLVEKPLATSVEDCDRIARHARACGKQVCVDHSLLYDFFVGRAREIVQRGAIGNVLTADYLRSSDYPPYRGGPLPLHYREGGFPFRDVGPHALYLLEAFLGEIQSVKADFRSQGGDPSLLYDEWRVMVRCANGLGQAHLSWNVRPLQNVLILQGTEGVLRIDLHSMSVALKRTTPLPKAAERALGGIVEGLQILKETPLNSLRFVRKKILHYHGLQMLVAEFYRCLAAGEPVPVSPERARPIVRWTEQVAAEGDTSKERFVSQFCKLPTATVLVTGASGFIGRRLLSRLLEEGKRVRVLVRREPPPGWLNNPQLDVVLGDLGDPEAVDRAVAGTQVIYHVGGTMSGAAHDHERGSVTGTRNVVESALRHGVRRLIFISSLSVLCTAAPGKNEKVTENWPIEPFPSKRGHYSQAKCEAEQIVREAVQHRGLQAVILRPGKVIGPGAELMTGDVARRTKNRLVILGGGKITPPMIYVEDLVDAILLAAKSSYFDGSVFHIVDHETMTQNEIAREYFRIKKQSCKIVHLPMLILYSMAFGIEILGKVLGRPVPLSIYRVRSATAPLSFDCGKATRQLGWRPVIGIREGLERALGPVEFRLPHEEVASHV